MSAGNERQLDWSYRWGVRMGAARAQWQASRGRIRREGQGGTPLVGADVQIKILGEGAEVVVSGRGTEIPPALYMNPFVPEVAAIGMPPYWRFQNPGTTRKTTVRLQKNCKLVLRPNVLICPGVYLSVGGASTFEIEENSYIGHEAQINTRCGLKIGAGTLVGQQVVIADYDGHPIYQAGSAVPIAHTGTPQSYGGGHAAIEIGKNVWIGMRAIILKGARIGEGAIIGAGSCVTTDIPPHTIAAGNPAKVIREGISWKNF